MKFTIIEFVSSLLRLLNFDTYIYIRIRNGDLSRDCFPGQQLLSAVMRYLTDPTQTPNSRVKVAALTFITQIAETAEPSALGSSAATALARLLDWSNDGKSHDVRRHAQNAVISLYNLNPPQVTMIFSELPKYYQVC